MFIAFEGPDNTGKSTSANALASDGEAIYQATKSKHAEMALDPDMSPDLVVTYDRIDWFSHMVYRLALPDKEWHDAQVRTVFAMPDTHLVVKLHRPDLANFIEDQPASHTGLVTETPVGEVNPMYYYFADFIMSLNVQRDFALFKTVSIIEVANDPSNGTFTQRLADFSSPVFDWPSVGQPLVHDDASLLDFLRYEEQNRV